MLTPNWACAGSGVATMAAMAIPMPASVILILFTALSLRASRHRRVAPAGGTDQRGSRREVRGTCPPASQAREAGARRGPVRAALDPAGVRRHHSDFTRGFRR